MSNSNDLRQQLKDLMEHKRLSQSQVATQINKSTAVVNQWLQGNYKGDSKKVDTAVEQLLNRYAQRSREIKCGYVETKTSKGIQNLISVTHSTGDIQLVIGEAGLGKTMAITQYAKSHDDVIFVEVEPTYNAKVLLTSLCEKTGITPKRSNHDMMMDICSKLENSGRLIIVDEAELLGNKPLEILRRIHDLSGVGIVLAGMPRLRVNLRGKRGEFRQLYSRIGFCYDLGMQLSDDDMYELATAAMGTDEYNEKLIEISEGNARRMSKLAAGVNRYSEASGEPLCNAMIEQFAKRLIN